MDFKKLVEQVLQETTVMGGADSAMGPNVGATASAVSGNKWNPDDNRIAKSLYGGVISRQGINKKKRKKKK